MKLQRDTLQSIVYSSLLITRLAFAVKVGEPVDTLALAAGDGG
jgi:hypothetical protein